VVARVAALAKLEFSGEEMEAFVRRFQTIVAYVDRLNEVDTGPAGAARGGAAGWDQLREDRAQRWSGREQGLDSAPERAGTLFVVPRVVDKGDAHGAP